MAKLLRILLFIAGMILFSGIALKETERDKQAFRKRQKEFAKKFHINEEDYNEYDDWEDYYEDQEGYDDDDLHDEAQYEDYHERI